jgi:multidrug efflux pump
MIVIIGALGVRGGTMVGIAIPASFLIGILALSLAGLTINVVVLFSLILATGMLVDGAIVLVEYADRKMIEGLAEARRLPRRRQGHGLADHQLAVGDDRGLPAADLSGPTRPANT